MISKNEQDRHEEEDRDLLDTRPDEVELIEYLPEGRSRSSSISIKPTKRLLKQELLDTFSLAWPVLVTFLLQMGPGLINVVFLGHLEDKNALAAGTLATMYLNVTGNTVGYGLASAMDTLCSSYYGKGDFKSVGHTLQRALIILTLTAIPILFVWLYAEAILVYFHQDPEIARLAGVFCRYSLPGLFGVFWYEPLKKYLQSQRIVKPSMYVTLLANVWCIVVNYVLMYKLKWGFIGAPIARSSANWIMIIGILLYIRFTKTGKESMKCWTPWSRASLQNWGPFLKLALPGLVMSSAEYWAFEIQTLFAGIFGAKYLAAQSVIIQIIVFAGMIPVGLSVAVSIRLGLSLGRGQAVMAKLAAYTSIILNITLVGLISVVIYFQRSNIPRIYTNVDDTIITASETIPIIALFLVLDGTQAVISGILRSIGRQQIGAVLNIVCYYGIGLPLGYYLGFVCGRKTRGLWEAMFVALLLITTLMLAIVYTLDWDKEVIRAHQRLERNRSSDLKAKHPYNDEESNSIYVENEHSAATNSV